MLRWTPEPVRRSTDARGLQHGSERGEPVALSRGPPGEERRQEVAGVAQAVGKVVQVAQQQVGRQARGAEHGGRRVERAAGLQCLAGGGFGGRSRSGLHEGAGHGHGTSEETGHGAGGDEALWVVGRRGRDEPELKALRRPPQGDP